MNLRRRAALGLVTAAGLVAGLSAAAWLERPRHGAAPPEPSIARFPFSTGEPASGLAPGATDAVPPFEPGGVPGRAGPDPEPAGGVEAVRALLEALVDGRPEAAWALLDEPGRRRHPSPAAWARSRAGAPRPTGFEVAGAAPAGAGQHVSVLVSYRPSLDPFAGLVPARSEQVWAAQPEGGAWRVAPEPAASRYVLPPDAGASEVVRAWLLALAACDRPAARALQAVDHLYGPADLAAVPCGPAEEPAVGPPLSLDRAPDPGTLLAAFGSDAGAWARVVPVRSSSNRFLAAVAPLGDAWRVMGVTADT